MNVKNTKAKLVRDFYEEIAPGVYQQKTKRPKFFLTQIFLEPKILFGLKIFLEPKFFFDPRFFWAKIFFSAQKFVLDPKFF